MAISYKVPCYTLLTAARAGVQAIRAMRSRDIEVAPLQDYFREEESELSKTVA